MIKFTIIFAALMAAGCGKKVPALTTNGKKIPKASDSTAFVCQPAADHITPNYVSTANGLCVNNAYYFRTFVRVPNQAEFVHSDGLHNPSWVTESKDWGLMINDDNRRMGQIDHYPPESGYDPTIFKYWQRSVLGGERSDNWVGVKLTDPCAVAEIEIEHRWEHKCPTGNPDRPMAKCPNDQIIWAGPGDVNFDGKIDSADASAFNSKPYDFNGDGEIDVLDQVSLAAAIQKASHCP